MLNSPIAQRSPGHIVPAVAVHSPSPTVETQAGIVRAHDLWSLRNPLPLDSGGYITRRGLSSANHIAARTPFGRIDANIQQRLDRRWENGPREPITLLTIGPGQGELEIELADRFGTALVIDTFTLSSDIIRDPQAFRAIFIGNLDTHRLPGRYDLVRSLAGALHAIDQRWTFAQIVWSCRDGAEACYNTLNPWNRLVPYATLPPRTKAERALLWARHQLQVECNQIISPLQDYYYVRVAGAPIPEVGNLLATMAEAQEPSGSPLI